MQSRWNAIETIFISVTKLELTFKPVYIVSANVFLYKFN